MTLLNSKKKPLPLGRGVVTSEQSAGCSKLMFKSLETLLW